MNNLNIDERIKIVKYYYTCRENIEAALDRWSAEFKNRPKPSHETVREVIERFNKTGGVLDDLPEEDSCEYSSD